MRLSSAVAFLVAAAAAPHAFAALFVTEPVASTSCQGGQTCTISWNDDGTAPLLAAIGPCTVGLFVGNSQQQTELQNINPSIDVSKQGQLNFVPNPTIGPNSNVYFIRFTSLGLKDTANPLNPYQSFSAKFTLAGMTGTFSPEIQQEITASVGAGLPPATAAPTTTSAPVAPTIASPTSSRPPTVTTSAHPTTTTAAKAGAALRGLQIPLGAASLGGLIAAAVGLAL